MCPSILRPARPQRDGGAERRIGRHVGQGCRRFGRRILHHDPRQSDGTVRGPNGEPRLGDQPAQRLGRETHGEARFAGVGHKAIALVIALGGAERRADGRRTRHLGQASEPRQHGVQCPLRGRVAIGRGARRHRRFHAVQPFQHGALHAGRAKRQGEGEQGVGVSRQGGGKHWRSMGFELGGKAHVTNWRSGVKTGVWATPSAPIGGPSAWWLAPHRKSPMPPTRTARCSSARRRGVAPDPGAGPSVPGRDSSW